MGDVGSGMARTQSAWAGAGPERERERLELGLTVPEEAEACFALPLRTTAHPTGRDSRASEAEVSGSNNGNAHTSIDKATHLGVRLLPFLS